MARGEAGARSDLDLLIEVDPDSPFSLFELVDLQDDLHAELGRSTHFAFASMLRPWLRQEILAEAIAIYRCRSAAVFVFDSSTSFGASPGSNSSLQANPSTTTSPTGSERDDRAQPRPYLGGQSRACHDSVAAGGRSRKRDPS